jgi:hypothetical protein
LYLPLMYRYSFLSTSCASAVWITLAVRLPLKRVGLSCVRLWSDQWKPKVTCKVLWRHRGPILGDLIDVPLSIWSNGGSTMSDDGAQQQCLQLNWQSLSRSPLCWARSPIMTMTDHVTMMMTSLHLTHRLKMTCRRENCILKLCFSEPNGSLFVIY